MDPLRVAPELSARVYVIVPAPVPLVVPVVPVEIVIQVAVPTVAVHELLGDPAIVRLFVSPPFDAPMSLAGVGMGADSIAITREPKRTYSFEGKDCAVSEKQVTAIHTRSSEWRTQALHEYEKHIPASRPSQRRRAFSITGPYWLFRTLKRKDLIVSVGPKLNAAADPEKLTRLPVPSTTWSAPADTCMEAATLSGAITR
jgi:hypothetical protein